MDIVVKNIENGITEIKQQNGDTICNFIAAVHACFLKDKLSVI